MHTSTFTKTVFIHHGDCSGEVIIQDLKGNPISIVEFEDLLAFVAQYVAGEKISRLESAEPREILGLDPQTSNTLVNLKGYTHGIEAHETSINVAKK